MMVRRVLVVAAFVAATTSLAPTAPPANAGDGCLDGVIVVVDASAFGAGIFERCVPGAPGTGLDALAAAGHASTFVPRQPGLVCTIDARPDPCNGAPTDAYWSYWYADQGGGWQYSNRGAGNRSPQPGTVEGWRFGSGSPPGVPPPNGDPEPEPDPEPDPDQDPAEEPSSGSGSGGSGDSGSSRTDSSEPNGSGSSGSSGSASGTSGSNQDTNQDTTGSPSTDTSPDDPERDDPDTDTSVEPAEPADEVPVDDTAGYRSPADEEAEPADRPLDTRTLGEDGAVARADHDDGGVPVGAITGSGLVAGLAALTALQLRRRRLGG